MSILLRAPFAILSLAFALSPLARASQPRFDELHCRKQVQKTLEQWAPNAQWRSRFTANTNEEIFETPTTKVGVWVELRMLRAAEPNGPTVELRRVTDSTQIRIRWKSPECSGEIVTVIDEKNHNQNEFGDGDLDETLKKSADAKSKGLIYIWSRGMPLSMTGREEVRAWARSNSIELIELVDSATQKSGEKTNSSTELLRRGMGIHFPTMIFFKAGVLSPNPILGYKKPDEVVKLASEAGL